MREPTYLSVCGEAQAVVVDFIGKAYDLGYAEGFAKGFAEGGAAERGRAAAQASILTIDDLRAADANRRAEEEKE
jgi:hypothetical protein